MKNKIIWIICLAFLVFITQSCKKETTDVITLSVKTVIGNASVSNGSGEKALNSGDVINKGDSIATGSNSFIDIMYGNKGIIRILEKTKVEVADLFGAQNDSSSLKMKEGKLFGTLGKLGKGKFQVFTPTIVASIRGTSFRVTAGKTISRVDCLKGKVKISVTKDDLRVESEVAANEYAEIDIHDTKAIAEGKKEINVEVLTAEDKQEIQKEVRSINVEAISELDVEVKRELKVDVLQLPENGEPEKKQVEKTTQSHRQATQKGSQPVHKTTRESADQEQTVSKEEVEAKRREEIKRKKEKEAREKAANIPTL